MSSRLGSLEKGKQAAILAVEVDGIDVNEIFPFLVQRGEKNSVKWLDGFNG
jgi:hypothetical protein